MKHFSFVALADAVFSAFLIFILSFVILNYFTPRPYSIVLAICVALFCSLLLYKLFSAKRQGRTIKETDRKTYEKVMTALCFMPKTAVVSLFEKSLKTAGKEVVKRRYALAETKENLVHVPVFSFEDVTKTDVVKAFNLLNKSERAVIYAEDYTAGVKAFAARFNGRIILKNGKEAYKLLKNGDNLSEIAVPELTINRKYPSGIKMLFNSKNAKKYAVTGLVFLAMSYLVPIKTYYVICGAVFLVLALFTKLFGVSPVERY